VLANRETKERRKQSGHVEKGKAEGLNKLKKPVEPNNQAVV